MSNAHSVAASETMSVVAPRSMDERSSSLPRSTLRPTSRGKIVGRHPQLTRMLETIDRIARSTCTVLVTGETGTGKELFAAAVHDASVRRGAPLVTVNCGAIPTELVEAELFGHTRGAFTGAQAARSGFVAEAEGGTLFLDEIGELPMPVQTKLLRLLQQREYTPLGTSREVKADVRIVAATHRDLAAEVQAGRFREDLYYRLNVIHLHLPALRERAEDIRPLATHFFRSVSARVGRQDLRGISENAYRAIEAEPWRGNVRALENAMERGVLLAAGPYIEREDLLQRSSGAVLVVRSAAAPTPAPPAGPRPSVQMKAVPGGHPSNPAFPRVLPETGMDMGAAMTSYQNHLIRQALQRTAGNKNRAARLLGLNRTTLVEIIRRRGL